MVSAPRGTRTHRRGPPAPRPRRSPPGSPARSRRTHDVHGGQRTKCSHRLQRRAAGDCGTGAGPLRHHDPPSVADGKIPLVLHLLSPAGRPVQITADLPGFWAGSWSEVRKEMAGRYPKHHWPLDPASATRPSEKVGRLRRSQNAGVRGTRGSQLSTCSSACGAACAAAHSVRHTAMQRHVIEVALVPHQCRNLARETIDGDARQRLSTRDDNHRVCQVVSLRTAGPSAIATTVEISPTASRTNRSSPVAGLQHGRLEHCRRRQRPFVWRAFRHPRGRWGGPTAPRARARRPSAGLLTPSRCEVGTATDWSTVTAGFSFSCGVAGRRLVLLGQEQPRKARARTRRHRRRGTPRLG